MHLQPQNKLKLSYTLRFSDTNLALIMSNVYNYKFYYHHFQGKQLIIITLIYISYRLKGIDS